MKKVILLISAVFVAMPLLVTAQDVTIPELSGPYLGQKPPGMTPEIFAEGIISVENKSSGSSAFNRDGTMFIFKRFHSRQSNVIYITEIKNGKWCQPYEAPFESKFYDGDFTLAPDGKTLLISSRRPLDPDDNTEVQSSIWKSVYQSGKWSGPEILDYTYDTTKHESYPYLAADGTLYLFCRDRGGYGKSDMFLAEPVNGRYPKLENMGDVINTAEHEWDPYIAPDESYMIYCSTKPGGYGSDDFYITFRRSDGSWTEPENMGEEINSSGSDNRPYVTLDGKYFFYTGDAPGTRQIYWVDAKIIDTFRPEELR